MNVKERLIAQQLDRGVGGQEEEPGQREKKGGSIAWDEQECKRREGEARGRAGGRGE